MATRIEKKNGNWEMTFAGVTYKIASFAQAAQILRKVRAQIATATQEGETIPTISWAEQELRRLEQAELSR